MKGGAVCDEIEPYEEISNRSLQDFNLEIQTSRTHIFKKDSHSDNRAKTTTNRVNRAI